MAKRFVIPFATSGDKSVTPDATDPGGAISYSQGWPAAYQLPDTDPAYRPVGRQEMNGVLFDVTGALAELQTLGFPEWVAVAGLVTPYAINAVVRHNNANWRNAVANNSVEPGIDATWVVANEAPPMLTTAGAAPNFTLTPSPAISGYVVGQPFRVKFSATPVGVPTLNVSAKGAKNLKQYDASGAKIQAIIVADQIADVVYDGTDVVLLDALQVSILDTVRIDVASAATVNLTSSAPNTRNINITGGGTINGFTVEAGRLYFARFNAAGVLTNSASLVTQHGGNITTAAGDTCIIRATAANVVEILCGSFLSEAATGTLGQTYQDFTASRVSGTTYTNSTGRAIEVYITVTGSASAETNTVEVGGFTVFTGDVGVSGSNEYLSFKVPLGLTYKVTVGPSLIARWVELR
jgi:hypothetical protein